MKKEERTYKMYLEDILESIEVILEFIQGFSFDEFRQNRRTVDAVIRNFEIIGEASKNLPKEIKDKYPDVPWQEMYLLRNKVSHAYFGVDLEIIWDVSHNNLPENRLQILSILQETNK